jgi:hypothetical protein
MLMGAMILKVGCLTLLKTIGDLLTIVSTTITTVLQDQEELVLACLLDITVRHLLKRTEILIWKGNLTTRSSVILTNWKHGARHFVFKL